MRHVLVTGGSSGIGLAVAALLLARGDRVSLIARDEGRLSKAQDALSQAGTREQRVTAVPADVTDAQALTEAVARCTNRFGAIDMLVACAGIVEPARFVDQDGRDFDRQIAVNVTGVTNSLRSVLPAMLKRGRGRIGIVSSGAGLIGIPGYSAYCASKFALRGLAAALRLETAGSGVSVSICFPPDTLTPQLEREVALRPPDAQAIMGRIRPLDAQTVASIILAGVEKNRREIHFGLILRLLGSFGPFASTYIEMRHGQRYAIKVGDPSRTP